ncbi:MAG: radical SAM protein, partial [Rickettsiales bacterium]|nr:radical SAM protein [Rickettsiales bacterium]
MRKNFYIKTFGCQMNVYDSQKIFDLMAADGYSCVHDLNDADVIILNTCYIREKASEKIFSELGRIKALLQKSVSGFSNSRESGRPIFIITGCVAKAEGENIFKRIPYVDAILSSSEYYLMLDIIQKLQKNPDEKISYLNLTGTKKFDYLVDVKSSSNDYSAFVAVQEGCDNFCTYCVVPNTRGREVSRNFESVLDEVRSLNNGKTVEITLLGQNVSSYNGVDTNNVQKNLADLLREIDAMDFVKRIRYITSYPTKLSDDLIALHASSKKMMPLF